MHLKKERKGEIIPIKREKEKRKRRPDFFSFHDTA